MVEVGTLVSSPCSQNWDYGAPSVKYILVDRLNGGGGFISKYTLQSEL